MAAISNYFNVRHAIVFPYARTSLYYILKGLRLKKESQVLMTPFNIYPMVDVIRSLGLKACFIDINLEDYGPDYEQLEEALKRKPCCFVLTHLFGYIPNMELICNLCAKYEIPLIEDISQAIGAQYKGSYLGTFGIASMYSASLGKFVDGYNGSFVLTNCNQLNGELLEYSLNMASVSKQRIRRIVQRTLC